MFALSTFGAAEARGEGLEREVALLVEAWVAAQNAPDFAAYERLYAQHFVGVKRSGPRTRRFDRRGWMADRRPFFGGGVEVSASDVLVHGAGAGAVVRLTQRWRSPKYEDVGPKRLVLIREGDTLRISREEMIEAKVLRGAGGRKATTPRRAALVVYEQGPWLVLRDHVPASWARGDARRLRTEGVEAAVKPARAAKLPAAIGVWRGRRLVLEGPDGKVCDGVVKGFSVMARVHPHWEMRAAWRDALPEDVAKEVWALGADRRLLVARVESERDCREALWARPEAGAPGLWRLRRVSPAGGTLEQRALAAFEALPAWEEAQRAFEAEAAAAGKVAAQPGAEADAEVEAEARPATGRARRWHDHDGAAPTVRVFGLNKKRPSWIAVAASSGPGCGGFYREVWAIWAVEGDALRLLTDGAAPGPNFSPVGGVRLRRKGPVRFTDGVRVMEVRGGEIRWMIDATPVDLDCPC